jgi:pyridinium-3,5-biscarboxylic acid mononucleotide sulfurtransferase
MTEKLTHLIKTLKDMQSAVLAYSGGVDSSFLLKAIQLSGIKSLAVIATSEIRTFNELEESKRTAEELGIKYIVIKTEEFSREEFVSNTPERCFFCKNELFDKLTHIASSEGYRVVIDGSTVDDTFDYRPGSKAARKYNIRTPLIEADFSKKEVRELSKQLGLQTWNKPSSPCLATRIPYGRRITKEVLKRIERAEDFMKSLGFQEVRVRDYDSIARIEVPEDKIEILLKPLIRENISETLKVIGYIYITLDLDGYKSGSMNRVLNGKLSIS